MASYKEGVDYNNITDLLVSTFGNVCSREAIYSIVESCSGDIELAAHMIVSITSEEIVELRNVNSNSSLQHSPNSTNTICPTTTEGAHCLYKIDGGKTPGSTSVNLNMETPTNASNSLPKISYAGASKLIEDETVQRNVDHSYRSVPRTNLNVYSNCTSTWTEQIKSILKYHNKGARTLIFMRGAPGSGKSYLARQIQEITVGANPINKHIFSTDDYFETNGKYVFDKLRLSIAHEWNQTRAYKALEKGVSPVIIDNTNIGFVECAPYASIGVLNGYIIEVVEPNTHWARNAHQLTHRNKHGVPLSTIKRMLDLLKSLNLTSTYLMRAGKLTYRGSMQPPVLRRSPEILTCSSVDGTKEGNKFESKVGDQCNVEYNEQASFMEQNVNETEMCGSKTSLVPKYTMEKEDKVIEPNDSNQIEVTSERKKDETYTDATDLTSIPNIALESEYTPHVESRITMETNIEMGVGVASGDAQIINEPNYTENTGNKINFTNFIEELERVEDEWDNGEAWEEENDNKQKLNSSQISPINDPKLPRKKTASRASEYCLPLDSDNDWRTMCMPMSSLADNNNVSNAIKSNHVVETKSAETCMEIGDTELSYNKDGIKILSTVARDINLNYSPSLDEKIPEKRMFDKSSTTNEHNVIMKTGRCVHEEIHFKQFRKMFKELQKSDLRYIFDNCCGDVNWAVGIVVEDDSLEKIRRKAPEDISESEDEEEKEVQNSNEGCDCAARYGVIPDAPNETSEAYNPSTSTGNELSTQIKTKQKKDFTVSDKSLALKRQIEQNIVIADQHYSDVCLKVRKMRRGELGGDVSSGHHINTGITMQNTNQTDFTSSNAIDNNETNISNITGPSTYVVNIDEKSDEPALNEVEKSVDIYFGYEFLNQLDTFFGRTDMVYPKNLEPKISMPISLLNEINALWMESIMYQLETESKSREAIIKQDAEFARELEMKERHYTLSGKEPEVPDLKEIMDMEVALSLYRKDCEESMLKERPTDLAAKLTIKKLYDLFPELPQKDLDVIYMAHDFDFHTTVMVLLETQGRTEITEAENGVNKFIMAQELKRQEMFLAAEKQRLMEESWPELPSNINLKTVEEYRIKAKQFLMRKNEYFCTARGKLVENCSEELAKNYKTLSDLYMLKCEQANCIAAASLLQIKSTDYTTLDLHYLHVNEALEALDIFIDSHIQRLRGPGKKKCITVYIITGRGLHSPNGPVIKPAVIRRLWRRDLYYRERNPGLIAVKILPENILSYQLR